MKHLILITSLILFTLASYGQIVWKGVVVDSASGKPLSAVRVENITLHQGDITDRDGRFTISGDEDHYIVLSLIGYKNKVYRLQSTDHNQYTTIRLAQKPLALQNVTIHKEKTQYQIDSANRAEIYQDVFEYERTKSVMSPVTSIYQKFSKKHRDIQALQNQIVDFEKQKFIDTRYSESLTKQLTKLDGEELIKFMQQYPMAYDYARAASDLEIKMWIKYNFQEYQQKNKNK